MNHRIEHQLTTLLGPAQSSRRVVIGAGAGTLAVKVAGAITALLLTALLARLLSPAGFGEYAYVLAWVSVLSIPVQFGLPTLVLRETARALANGEFHLMTALWRWADRFAGSLWLCLLAACLPLLLWPRFHIESATTLTFAAGLLLIPLIALGNLRGAALCGMQHPALGNMPELMLRPALFACLLLFAGSLQPAITPLNAMTLHAIAAAMVLFAAHFMRGRHYPTATAGSTGIAAQPSQWVRAALPLGLLSGAQLIVLNTDIVMLGLLRPPEIVGTYKAALTIAALVAFGLTAVNAATAPFMARFYAERNMVKLQRLATVGARAGFCIALPVLVLIVFYGSGLIALIFGEGYRAGAGALTILAAGQLGNAAAGSAGVLLNMTGHVKEAIIGVGCAALLNVLLNALLIPTQGAQGAAIATTASLLLWNLLLWQFARKRTGINSSVF